MARKSVFRAGRFGNGGKPQVVVAMLQSWSDDLNRRLAALEAVASPKMSVNRKRGRKA